MYKNNYYYKLIFIPNIQNDPKVGIQLRIN